MLCDHLAGAVQTTVLFAPVRVASRLIATCRKLLSFGTAFCFRRDWECRPEKQEKHSHPACFDSGRRTRLALFRRSWCNEVRDWTGNRWNSRFVRLLLVERIAWFGAGAIEPSRAAADRLAPGLWENETTVNDVTFGGLQGQAVQIAEQMRTQLMGKKQTSQECLTAEEANSEYGGIGMGEDAVCRFERFDMANGVLAANGKCQSAKDGEMTVIIRGTYTPTRLENTTDLGYNAPGGGTGGIGIKLASVRKRIGERPAK